MISKFNGGFAAMAVLFCATAAFAQDNRGTAAQRAACMSDAFRLCASSIPDPTRVEECLRQNKSELSDGCRLIFEQSAGPVASRSK
jgi:hypothetical protein